MFQCAFFVCVLVGLRLFYVTYWLILPVICLVLFLVAVLDFANRSEHTNRALMVTFLMVFGSFTPRWLVNTNASYLGGALQLVKGRMCESRVSPVRRNAEVAVEVARRVRLAGIVTIILFDGIILRGFYTGGGFTSTAVGVLPLSSLLALQLMHVKDAMILHTLSVVLAVLICLRVTPDSAYFGVSTPVARVLFLVLYPSLVL